MSMHSGVRKGIILATSAGSRLYPATAAIGKSLVPIYDKPLIYYPLSVLISAGVRQVLIIAPPDDIRGLVPLLADGARMGLRIHYAPKLASQSHLEALQAAGKFIQREGVAIALADQLFYGAQFDAAIAQAAGRSEGGTIFAKAMSDPRLYGVVELASDGRPVAISERPVCTASRWGVTGLYFFDRWMEDILDHLHGQPRRSITLTDLVRVYLERGLLHVAQLDHETSWFDVGTHDVALSAAVFVEMIQNECGHNIGCIEDAAYQRGLISAQQLLTLAANVKNGYCHYLRHRAFSGLTGWVE